MPVQRIPRYNMLLRDLVKHTWEDHMDYTALTQAVARVEDIAGFLNDKKREAENVATMLELEQTITGKNVPVSFFYLQNFFLFFFLFFLFFLFIYFFVIFLPILPFWFC